MLEPKADAFRNYLAPGLPVPAEYLLLERAQMLTLTGPELTVLVGGLRVLGANTGGSSSGVLTKRPGTLTNDFFVNLLDLDTEWQPMSGAADSFAGRTRKTGEVKWIASRVDLIFGRELRAPRAGRGLRVRRRPGEVREGLRRRVGTRS